MCNVPADELQFVQTVNSTAHKSTGDLTGEFRFSEGGVDYGGFVDGGVNSKFGKQYGPAQPTGPYYNDPTEQARYLTWNGSCGSNTIFDGPNTQNNRDVVRFQTMLIARNYMGSGQDLLLGSFEWGWTGTGTSPTHGASISLSNNITTNSANILNFDYPKYKLLK